MPTRASFDRGETRIVTAAIDETNAVVWGMNGERLLELPLAGSKRAALSPDGRLVATTAQDKSLQIWNMQGDLVTTLPTHEEYPSTIQFSPDGKTIASGSFDTTVRLWNLDGHELAVLRGNARGISDTTFSQDGSRLATASGDNTTRIWHLRPEDLVAIARRRVPRAFDERELRRYAPLLGPEAPGHSRPRDDE